MADVRHGLEQATDRVGERPERLAERDATAAFRVVLGEDGEQRQAADQTEACKILAAAMQAEGWFNACRMMVWNDDWIATLKPSWRDRLNQICDGRQDVTMARHFSGPDSRPK